MMPFVFFSRGLSGGDKVYRVKYDTEMDDIEVEENGNTRMLSEVFNTLTFDTKTERWSHEEGIVH